jgi:hypothetical protein
MLICHQFEGGKRKLENLVMGHLTKALFIPLNHSSKEQLIMLAAKPSSYFLSESDDREIKRIESGSGNMWNPARASSRGQLKLC